MDTQGNLTCAALLKRQNSKFKLIGRVGVGMVSRGSTQEARGVHGTRLHRSMKNVKSYM